MPGPFPPCSPEAVRPRRLAVAAQGRRLSGPPLTAVALSQAFTELQAKVIDTQQKVKLADIQIEQLSKTKKHAHLTDTEVMMLVDETRMYEGVGRM